MSENNNPYPISEFLYGKEYTQRMVSFEKDMDELNKKYADQLEKGDSLLKHVFIQHPDRGDNRTYFNIRHPEGLPEEAKIEMRNLFTKHYDPRNKSE